MARAETNPDWYRLMYSLAATYANRSAQTEASDNRANDPEGTSQSAWEDAYRAAAVADRALAAGAALGQNAPERVATLFDRTFAPTLLVLWAGAKETTDRLAVDRRRVVPDLPAKALAGASVSPAGDQVVDGPPADGVRRALERLYPEARASTDPDAVVRLVCAARPVHYRVTYNVACYWSQRLAAGRERPSDVDPARLLTRAINGAPGAQSARMAAQALNDPSLAPLFRADPSLRETVSGLAKAHADDSSRESQPPRSSSAG
jgi:hypothetical protein